MTTIVKNFGVSTSPRQIRRSVQRQQYIPANSTRNNTCLRNSTY